MFSIHGENLHSFAKDGARFFHGQFGVLWLLCNEWSPNMMPVCDQGWVALNCLRGTKNNIALRKPVML